MVGRADGRRGKARAGRPDPRPEGDLPWTNLEAEEQRDRLLGLIAKLPPERRQAFLLHALEGYATDEIAMLQDRPESEVMPRASLAETFPLPWAF